MEKVKEILLECGCHKIDSNGNLYSCVKQLSKKGHQGFITIKTDNFVKVNPTVRKSGYVQVNIHGRIIRLNRLMAKTFLKNPNNLPEVRHLDGDKLNNNINNLAWGTAKDNAADREMHGNTRRGSKHGKSKISEKIAWEIFNSKISLLKTAIKYGVSKKLVLLIKQKKCWKHIHDLYHDK